MADFNPVFEVDAGKILAKLHLAGQSQVKNAIVINTAIKNPDKGADPEKPGDVQFDLENKTGEYLLAIIRPLEYNLPIDPSKNKEYVKAKEALDKFMKDHEKELPKQDEEGKERDKEEENAEDKGKEEDKKDDDKKKEELDKKTSLTDKDAKKKTEVNDSMKVPSFLDFITEADDKDKEDKEDEDKPDLKLLAELADLQTKLLNVYDKYTGLKEYKPVEDKDAKDKKDKRDFAASNKLFEEVLTKVNKERLELKEKNTTECKKAALNDLKTYFINFAGKDNQAKIKDADIVVKNATAEDHLTDPKEFEDNIKDYKIDVEDVDKQIQENQDKLQEDPAKVSTDIYKHDVALIVGYKVDIE